MISDRLRLCRSVLLICLSALLVACGSKETPQLPLLSSNAVILAFGDSLTYGTGVDFEHSYPAVLSKLIGRKVTNAGVPGELSGQGLARLGNTLDAERPDLLILIHGGNDFLRGQSVQQLQNNLVSMINLAQSQGISVVMLSVPKPAIFLKPAEVYQTVAEQMQTPLDTQSLSEILQDRTLKSDQIHPNAAGYQLLAERIVQLLQRAGAI